jgi:hypothetical protein
LVFRVRRIRRNGKLPEPRPFSLVLDLARPHRSHHGLITDRIYQTRGGPDSLRWFWSLTVNGPMTRSDRVATLDEAKAQFQKSWDAWKAWAKLEESVG